MKTLVSSCSFFSYLYSSSFLSSFFSFPYFYLSMALGHDNWYQSNRSPAMAESVSWIWRKVDSLPDPISDFRGSPMHNPSGVSSWDPWSYGFPEPNPPPPYPPPPISPSSSYGADYWGYRDPPPPPISPLSSYRADYWGYGDPSPISPVSSSIVPPPMSYYYGNPPNVFPTPSNHRGCPMNTPSAYSYSRNQGYGFFPDSMDVGGRYGYETETVDRAREREGIGVLSGDERQERDSDYGRQERDSLNLAELRQRVKDLGRCQEKMESEVKASFKESEVKASFEESRPGNGDSDIIAQNQELDSNVQESIMDEQGKSRQDFTSVGEWNGSQESVYWKLEGSLESVGAAVQLDRDDSNGYLVEMKESESVVVEDNGEPCCDGEFPIRSMISIPDVFEVFISVNNVSEQVGNGNIVGKTGSAEVKLTMNEILGNKISVEMNAYKVFEEMPTKNLVLFGFPADLKDGARLGVHVDPVNEDSNETVHRLVDRLKTTKSSKIISDLMGIVVPEVEPDKATKNCIMNDVGKTCEVVGILGSFIFNPEGPFYAETVGDFVRSKGSVGCEFVINLETDFDEQIIQWLVVDMVFDRGSIYPLLLSRNQDVSAASCAVDLIKSYRIFGGMVIFDPGGVCASTGMVVVMIKEIQVIGASVVIRLGVCIGVVTYMILVFDPGGIVVILVIFPIDSHFASFDRSFRPVETLL